MDEITIDETTVGEMKMDWQFDFSNHSRIDIILLIPRLILFKKATIRDIKRK